MIFSPAEISGMYIITLEPREDDRGSFARMFCQHELAKANIEFTPVQINQAVTKNKGAMRGLHLQTAPKEEAKVFQCLEGSIFDVVADIRPDSPTFGKWLGTQLDADVPKILYIPKGVAHGYQTLKDNCRVQYLVSEFYSPETEKGVRWNDPFFNISWPLPPVSVSEKDSRFPDFKK